MTETAEVTQKLVLISEVMSDGYMFVKIRFLLEKWEKQAEAGNGYAMEAMRVVDTMHKLCIHVKNN